MSNSFESAFAKIIGNEGRFKRQASDHMDWDSGIVNKGKLVGTKFGLSAGTYPDEDIPNMTLERAKFLYRRDWWNPIHGDDLEPHVAFQLFDADVNHGAGNGTRMLQRAVGVNDDGKFGPLTLAALKKMDPEEFIMRLIAERINFFTKCSTWEKDGKGWMNRMANNLRIGAD